MMPIFEVGTALRVSVLVNLISVPGLKKKKKRKSVGI